MTADTASLPFKTFFSLSANYFSYFAILGVLVPYVSVFFDGRGFSSVEIGQLLALLAAMRILAPNIWAALSDHLGRRTAVIRLGSFLALASFVGFYLFEGFIPTAITLMLFAFFWTAVLPQLEVVTLQTLASQSESYSRIRLWGSVGFIVFSVGGGFLLDWFGSEAVLPMGTLVLILLLLSSLLLTDKRYTSKVEQAGQSFVRLLKSPLLWLFFLANLLLQISHGPYYSFFVLYVEQLGHSRGIGGSLIAFGVIAEILIFLMTGRWLAKWGFARVFGLALLLTTVRWLLLAFVADYWLSLLIAQSLHAASFGVAHAASIQFLHKHFAGAHQAKGQALYASVCFGLGGALGALFSGFTWQDGAGAQLSFFVAAIFALLAWLTAQRLAVYLPRQAEL